MANFYCHSDVEFLPVFRLLSHEEKFTREEFQKICNEIKSKVMENEHNGCGWDCPDVFLKYAEEYGFKSVDILEIAKIDWYIRND